MSQVDSQDGFGWSAALQLSEFKYSILFMLAGEPTYGLDVKRKLRDYYGYEINHGKLYPNLDELSDDGLIVKGKLDNRTNEYGLTDEGLEVAVDRIEWALSNLIDDEEQVAELAETIEASVLSN